MAVTEIALLRFKSQVPSSATKQRLLLQVKKAQSEWSGYPVHFALQVEDPTLLYLFGGWDSVATHIREWIPSEINQSLLELLKDDITVEWMFHLDIDPAICTIPFNAPLVAINRYFVDPNKKTEFHKLSKAEIFHQSAPFTCSGGWRVDKEGGDEEFFLFSGCNKVEDHLDFEEKECRELGKIKEMIKGSEIKHVCFEKW